MNEFESLTLTGMPFFKSETFQLNQKGISLILGLNLDSSNNNTNGAGKSLFFSQLPEIIQGDPIIGNKRDLIRKGSTTVRFKRGKHHYEVTRSFKPSEKVTIVRDGADLEYRELSAAKAALAELLPYNNAEILSLLYLDSRVPHPLIRGSSAERKAFFTRFFRMNSAPTMRKLVKAELDGLATKAGEYKAHSERLAALKTKLAGVDVEALTSKMEKVKAKIDSTEKSAKRYAKVERVKEDYQDIKDDYKALKAQGVKSYAEAKEKSSENEESLTKITAQLAEWTRYEEYLETKGSSKGKRSALVKEIEALGFTAKPSETDITLHNTRIEEFDTKIEDYNESIKTLKGKLADVSESEVHNKTSKLNRLKASKKSLEEGADTCPTCGADYDNKHAKKELKALESQIETLKDEIGEANTKREGYQEKKTSLDKSLAKAETEYDLLRSVRKLRKELAALADIEEVVEPKRSKETLKEKRSSIKELQEVLVSARAVFEAVDAYRELSEEDLDLLKEASPTDSLMELHEKHSALKVQIDECTSLESEREELRTKLKVLKVALAEKEELDVLNEALSKKGVEPLMIRLVCQKLEHQVNRYARLLFPEDFRFSFELETQFNILVTRKYGKGEVTSDVRKLSGAESLLFSLILLIALLSFVPPKNRTNLLILDEPTSTFSPEMIEAFVKFLPTLNSVIPHIVVITPLPNSSYPGAKHYTVVKKGGKSRIVEGSGSSVLKSIKKEKKHDSKHTRRSPA